MVEPLRQEHEPKLAALALLEAGRLSERGRQRLLRHVARCEPCRQALAGLRRFETLAAEARGAEPPAIDWSRIERAALSAARSETRRRRALRWLPALAAAAALGLGARAWLARREPEPVAQPRPRTSAPATLSVEVTALVGTVYLRWPDGRREPLVLDSHPQPGSAIEADPGAEAHLALAGIARVLVLGDSLLQLNQLASDAVELGLARGSAVSKVQPLGDRRYELTAASYRVTVRGTHFEVHAEDGAMDVRVDEGHVHVLDVAGTRVADLIAPSGWASTANRPRDAPAKRPSTEARALRTARRASDAGDATFTIPLLPAVAAWHIDGDRLSAAGELRMRVPPGVLELGAELPDGRIVRLEVTIDALGTRFDPAWLRLPGPVRPAADRRGP
ncbi:MAG TPA: FecR family protein, partial [Polyangiales bacterium]|nr:FecR family protein [Polyangiales bacterium]